MSPTLISSGPLLGICLLDNPFHALFKTTDSRVMKPNDLTDIVDEALIRLEKLAELYTNGTIEQKRYIIGSIYPEKWTIFNYEGRTAKVNSEALLIYQINSKL